MASLERDLREAEKVLKQSAQRHAEMEKAIQELNAMIEAARQAIEEMTSANEAFEAVWGEVIKNDRNYM